MTPSEIQTILQSHATKHGWKMASISRNKHPCPIDGIGGRSLYDVWRGKKVGAGSIAIIERFFANLNKETNV